MDRLNNAVALCAADVFMRILWDPKEFESSIGIWSAERSNTRDQMTQSTS